MISNLCRFIKNENLVRISITTHNIVSFRFLFGWGYGERGRERGRD